MNRIDEFFRKKLATHSDKPSQSEMNDMASLLNQRSGKKRGWFLWLLVLLLIGGGTLAWLNSDFATDFGVRSMENKNTPESQREQASTQTNTASANLEVHNHSTTNEDLNTEGENSTRSESSIKSPNENVAANLSEVNPLGAKSSHTKKRKNKSREKSLLKTDPIKTKTVVDSENPETTGDESTKLSSGLIQSPGGKTPNDIPNISHLAYLPYSLLERNVHTSELETGTIIPSDTNALLAKPELRWSVRASAGPEFFRETTAHSLTDDNYGYTNKATGMSFQLGVLRHFDNWEFGTGLRYTSFKQPEFEDTVSSLRIYFYQSPETLIKEQYNNPELREKLNKYFGISSLQMLSIPIHVCYNFCSDSKLHVIPFARLNINFVQQELLDFLPGSFEWFIQTDEYTTSLYELWHQRRIRSESKITLGASLGVELRYTLSRRFYCSGLFAGSWFFGPVDERLPNSKYLSTSLEALIGFKF